MKWRKMIYTFSMLETAGRSGLGSTRWMAIAKSVIPFMNFKDVFGMVSSVTLRILIIEKNIDAFFSIQVVRNVTQIEKRSIP